MTPGDVEYLLTSATRLIQRAETKVSLATNADGIDKDRLQMTMNSLKSAATELTTLQVNWSREAMPHRQNAGELE